MNEANNNTIIIVSNIIITHNIPSNIVIDISIIIIILLVVNIDLYSKRKIYLLLIIGFIFIVNTNI